MIHTRKQRGIAALLTVIVIGMATLAMVITSTLLGIDRLDTGVFIGKSREALALADSCLDDALRRLKIDPLNIPADYSLSLDNGSCIINISDGHIIRSTGQVENLVRHLQADFSVIGDRIILNDWQEI